MSIHRIPAPLPGERVLALSPGSASAAASVWLRRPNLFPGRALTEGTLAQRQQWQAGRIALRGQDWVAGVVAGLELSLLPGPGEGFDATRVHLEPGRALAVGGEDLVLHRALECSLADLPVVAPPSFFRSGGGMGDVQATGSLRARALQPPQLDDKGEVVGSKGRPGLPLTLGQLGDASLAALPSLGVLVLQPVLADRAHIDPRDPCELSALDEERVDSARAFEDWRLADAVRLLWYAWPREWRAITGNEAQRRNAMAWTIFQAEAALAEGEALPWEHPWGVPLALVALDSERRPLWVDRASVVRSGGRARDGRLQLLRPGASGQALRLVANSRLPSLWQAQIEQLAEQLGAASADPRRAALLREGFGRFLPPVGLLPRSVMAFGPARNDFFPAGFDVDAVPVPLEQIDLAVRASAGLAPLNLNAAESVRLLVPVPLASWEPRLLLRDLIDPDFEATLNRFVLDRARALGARQGLREREAVLTRAISGVAPKVPPVDADPSALEPETLAPWGPPPAGGGHRSQLKAGVHQHYFERAADPLLVDGDRLYAWVYLDAEHPPRELMLQWHVGGQWRHRAFWGEDLIDWGVSGEGSRRRMGPLPALGRWLRLEVPVAALGFAPGAEITGMAFTLFDGRAAYGTCGMAYESTDLPWFGGLPPPGVGLFGDEPFDTLTHNDLWSPFEPDDSVEPLVASQLPPEPGAHWDAPSDDVHQHFIEGVSAPFAVNTGDKLYCWVYLDPNNPPREVMLQWLQPNDSWRHRAFWGQDLIGWGTPETASRRRVGGLPMPGSWVRLEVDAAEVELAGRSLAGVSFALSGGHAVFGATGAIPAAGGAERPWFAGQAPGGAELRGQWNFIAPRYGRSPGGGHHDGPQAGLHRHALEGVETPFEVARGERLFCWVWIDPANPPRELMLQWRRPESGWEQRAFWGENLIEWGTTGQASRLPMGALPAAGRWVRLEVSAAALGLEGTRVDGITFTLFDGHAVFGATGARQIGSGSERVWFSDRPPPRASLWGSPWQWISTRDMRTPAADSDTGQVFALQALHASPALSVLSVQERAQIFLRGAQGFVSYLKARADRADDVVDYGFVKVQTDVYRVRQLMLGSTAASRLVVSPALASIAQAETAVASQAQINGFLSDLQQRRQAALELSSLPARLARGGTGSGRVSNRGNASAQWTLAAAPSAGVTLTPSSGTLAPDASVSFSINVGNSVTAGSIVLTLTAGQGGAVTGGPATITVEQPAPPPPPPPPPPPNPGGAFNRVSAFEAGFFAFTPTFTAVAAAPMPLAVTAAATPAVRVQNSAFASSDVRAITSVQPIARAVGVAALTPILGTSVRDIAFALPRAAESFVRSTTVAERLVAPKSKEARDYAAQSRQEAIESLLRLHDEFADVDGGVTPGLFAGLDVRGLKDDDFLQGQTTVRPGTIAFHRFIRNPTLVARLANVPQRLAGIDPDESAYFSDTTDLADHVVALMRQLEARVRSYREAVSAAEQTLTFLRGQAASLGGRIAAASDRLAEARHDVSVARALLAEEQERIAAINARRARVLAEEVTFVAYVRGRESDNLLPTPTHALEPGLVDPPVPACLRQHPDVPDELDDMLRVVREAPSQWFVAAPPILRRLDRIEPLLRAMQLSQARAATGFATPAFLAAQGESKLGQALRKVAVRQAEALAPRMTALRTLDIVALAASTWQGARVQAEQVVSFGDLAEGGHGRADVARAAAAELDNIRRICTCLHAEFAGVLPSLRLDWAEILSEFDDPPNLRNLANLPRWSEVGAIDRRQMQGYVDWLFGQIEPGQPQAVALVNDVVRMCLLLASHAPVNRIVSGRLARPQSGVRPGVQLPIAVADSSRLRVGMQAVLLRGEQVLARAVVQDVGRGEVAAQVVHTVAAQVDLGADVRVQFDDAAALSLKGASGRRSLFGR